MHTKFACDEQLHGETFKCSPPASNKATSHPPASITGTRLQTFAPSTATILVVIADTPENSVLAVHHHTAVLASQAQLTDLRASKLTDRQAGKLADWLVGWQTGWLTDWLMDWQTGWVTDKDVRQQPLRGRHRLAAGDMPLGATVAE